MTYGASKERDMLRSVLPSSRRKGARDDKRAANQRHRARVRRALHISRDALSHEGDSNIMRDRDHASYDEHYVEYDLCDYDWDYDRPYAAMFEADRDYDRDIKEMMWDRRNGDKTAALERWAVAQTKGIRKRDRLSNLQARFPDNLITRHAMSHVEYLDEFDLQEWRYRYGPVMTDEERAWIAAAKYAQALEDLYKIATGPLDRFNKLIPKSVTRYYYTGGYSNWNRRPGPNWVLEDEVPAESRYWDTKQTWVLYVDRLQSQNHIEEWLAYVDGIPQFRNWDVDHAIEYCFQKESDDWYFGFDTKSPHGRKEKV